MQSRGRNRHHPTTDRFSKVIDDPVKRIAVLIRAAETIWPYKEESGRAAFSEAFDLAEVNFKEKGDKPRREGLALSIETPDQRYVVIRAVAKRDAVWASKMTDKMLEEESREAEANTEHQQSGSTKADHR